MKSVDGDRLRRMRSNVSTTSAGAVVDEDVEEFATPRVADEHDVIPTPRHVDGRQQTSLRLTVTIVVINAGMHCKNVRTSADT